MDIKLTPKQLKVIKKLLENTSSIEVSEQGKRTFMSMLQHAPEIMKASDMSIIADRAGDSAGRP